MDNQQRLIIGLVSLVLFLLGDVIGIAGLAIVVGEWLYGLYVTSSERIGPKPKLGSTKE